MEQSISETLDQQNNSHILQDCESIDSAPIPTLNPQKPVLKPNHSSKHHRKLPLIRDETGSNMIVDENPKLESLQK